MSTEREQLLDMLLHAGVKSCQLLVVDDDGPVIRVHTGPDDAVAVFGFDASERLVAVSVDES